MPIQYRNPSHNFETGMNRLRYMAPAWGSDPENTIRIRCQANGIPANLRREVTTSQGAEQLPMRREPDLRTKLKEKSKGPSTSAILAKTSNQDVQEARTTLCPKMLLSQLQQLLLQVMTVDSLLESEDS
jgi:hypothetical protein